MIKHVGDTATRDLLGGAIRQRGRPATGKAMTGAERQAARRAKLVTEGKTTLTVDVSIEVADALTAFIKFKDQSKDDVVERVLRNQLLRKR